jgi:hypothetical protein
MKRRSKTLLIVSGFAVLVAVGALRLRELSREKVNVTDEQLKKEDVEPRGAGGNEQSECA